MKHAPCHRVTAPKELYRHVKLLCSCNSHTPNFEQKSVNKAFLDFSSMSVTTIASDSEKNHFWWKQETWPSLVETKIAALYIYIPGVSRNVSQTFKIIVTVSVVADTLRWLETSIIRTSTNFIFPNSPTFPGFPWRFWAYSVTGKLAWKTDWLCTGNKPSSAKKTAHLHKLSAELRMSVVALQVNELDPARKASAHSAYGQTRMP